MRRLSNLSFVVAAWISFAAAPAPAHAQKTTPVPASHIKWKKIVVDKTFRSEGVAVADFNKDGKLDIFVGDCWYEAPDWKRHIVRVDKAWNPAGYSESFACFVDDFNGDGYPDVIVIPFPGKECFWYENPGKAGGKWKEHLLTGSACNETPIFVDLFKTGKKVLVMGWQPPGKGNMGEMCYFLPGKDPMGFLGTMMLGFAGSVGGGVIALLIFGGVNGAGLIGSVLVAALLLYVVRKLNGGGLRDPGEL